MNIQDARQEIIHTIKAYTSKNVWGGYAIPSLRQRPILLIGPPGIGKTAVMEQAARACGVNFLSYTMTHHTRQSALGLPFIEQKEYNGQSCQVTEYTMSEIIASIYQCMEETGCREGLLFLDEINCVSETLAPAILQLLQSKVFGNHRLPEGWILAAAGNPQEYNKSVRDFDIATLDRLKYIEVEADYDAWRAYALEHDIHGAILSYLDLHKDQFYVLKQTYASRSFATARGWEDLSCILKQYELLELPVTADLIFQYLHAEELSHDFYAFYQLYISRGKALPVEALLRGDPEAAAACSAYLHHASFDQRLQLAYLITARFNQQLLLWKAEKDRTNRFKAAVSQLERFQKLHGFTDFSASLNTYLSNEQDVLRVREQHNLSSDQELADARQTLYDLQNACYDHMAQQILSQTATDSIQEALNPGITQMQQKAKDLTTALCDEINTGIRFLAETAPGTDGDAAVSYAEGSELVLLLSALEQNTLARQFFVSCPSVEYSRYKKMTDFSSREKQLKDALRNFPV